MPNSSSSTSSKPTPAPASTPSASLLLPSRGGKRKATSISTSSAAPPLPSPSDTYEDDDDESDIQKPAKKKLKKVLEQKIPVWKDLKQWKDGEQPLSVFPLEVLDMIISVDSDLDLRDHLSLAGTCRFFRSCYRDVVFQILVQAAFPNLERFASDLQISVDGKPGVGHYFHADTYTPFGPFLRSFNEGRRLFSSGRSLVGAGGWNGWGLTRTEYDANQIEATKQKAVIEQLLLEYWNGHPIERTAVMDEELEMDMQNWDWTSRDKPRLEEKRARLIREQKEDAEDRVRQVFDLESPVPRNERRQNSSSSERSLEEECYDPWPSLWRKMVSEIVNRPTLTKAQAKSKYKISDRELLGLKEREGPWWSKAPKHYSKAAVEALSLRSHGGVGGHQEYLAKLEAKKTKAQATRTKNRMLAIYGPSGGSHQENER